MSPKHVILLAKVIAVLVAIALGYVGRAYDPTDLVRPLISAICILFTCYLLIPFGALKLAHWIHQWRHGCKENYSNLERL